MSKIIIKNKILKHKIIKVDLFKNDATLNPGRLVLTIKNLNGSKLRSALKNSGSTGRSWGRDIRKDTKSEPGALCVLDCKSENVIVKVVADDLFGPRGLILENDKLYVGTSENISVYNLNFKKVGLIMDKYYCWIHAIVKCRFNNKSLLLVSSSRLGTLIAFDLKSGKAVKYWHGWEHGFNRSIDGTFVVGSKEKFEKLKLKGNEVILIDKNDPRASLSILSTPKQAFRCTGIDVCGGNLYITLFSGEIVKITNFLNTRKITSTNIITSGFTNLHSPYVGEINGKEGIWYIDTMKGKLLCVNNEGEIIYEVDCLKQMYLNMPKYNISAKVWLQGFRFINNLVVMIDGTSNKIMILNLRNKTKRIIDIPDKKWAIHDLCLLNS